MINQDISGDLRKILWLVLITFLTIIISVLHYSVPTMKWQYHLIFMQSYFIPILIGSFQYGIRGGVGTALAVTILYLPHVMLQWGGLIEANMMRFLQVLLFNVIGYLTGLKAQKEKDEKIRYQNIAKELGTNYEKLTELEEQLRLADRLSVIGELTASLAHEVRNPLGAIRGAVEIIRDEVPENSKQFEFAEILIEETKRLNEVVENYLSFASKPKKKDIVYKITDVIKNSVLLLSNQAKKRGVDIKFDIPDYSLNLYGDPNDLRQIIINLTLNAIESIEGNGEVLIKAEQNSFNKNKETSSEQVWIISVTDTGKGMEESEINKIFKPFYSTKAEGSGLGMAIVKRIADSNNWKIKVKSTPNIGSEFKIIMPEPKK